VLRRRSFRTTQDNQISPLGRKDKTYRIRIRNNDSACSFLRPGQNNGSYCLSVRMERIVSEKSNALISNSGFGANQGVAQGFQVASNRLPHSFRRNRKNKLNQETPKDDV
jgi:hypothetical protein